MDLRQFPVLLSVLYFGFWYNVFCSSFVTRLLWRLKAMTNIEALLKVVPLAIPGDR